VNELEKIFWLKKGVIKVGDKKIKTGDPIPVEKVGKKTLEMWKKNGWAGSKIVVKSANENEALKLKINDLQKQIVSLKENGSNPEEVLQLKDELSDLKDANEREVSELKEELQNVNEANGKIVESNQSLVDEVALLKDGLSEEEAYKKVNQENKVLIKAVTAKDNKIDGLSKRIEKLIKKQGR